MIDILFPKLHKEGYRFLAIAGIVTFILLLISNFLGIISIIFTVWVYYFFRDPERFPINDENYLLSPADGVVSQITEINGPKEIGLENKKYTRISIFMNVFDCHVNRVPSSGKITQIFYRLVLKKRKILKNFGLFQKIKKNQDWQIDLRSRVQI